MEGHLSVLLWSHTEELNISEFVRGDRSGCRYSKAQLSIITAIWLRKADEGYVVTTAQKLCEISSPRPLVEDMWWTATPWWLRKVRKKSTTISSISCLSIYWIYICICRMLKQGSWINQLSISYHISPYTHTHRGSGSYRCTRYISFTPRGVQQSAAE